MKFALSCLMCLSIVGCGGDDGGSKDSKDPMVGLWVVEKNSSDFEVLNIRGDGTYRYSVAESIGNTYEIQQTDGEISYEGSEISLTPQRSTCASREPQKIEYTQSGDSLTLKIGSTSVVYVRSVESNSNDGEPESAVVTTGCFDATTGEFTAGDWVDL